MPRPPPPPRPAGRWPPCPQPAAPAGPAPRENSSSRSPIGPGRTAASFRPRFRLTISLARPGGEPRTAAIARSARRPRARWFSLSMAGVHRGREAVISARPPTRGTAYFSSKPQNAGVVLRVSARRTPVPSQGRHQGGGGGGEYRRAASPDQGRGSAATSAVAKANRAPTPSRWPGSAQAPRRQQQAQPSAGSSS